MTDSGFELVKDVYSCSEKCEYTTRTVEFVALHNFNELLDRLLQILGKDWVDDAFWSKLIWPLRRIWFDIALAPLSNAYLKEQFKSAADLVQPNASIVADAYPSAAPIFRVIGEQLSQMVETKLDHILDEAIAIQQARPVQSTAILVQQGRLVPLVEKTIRMTANLRDCQVISFADLREKRCFDRLLVFGLPRWYPDNVFSAPRAREICVVKYKWMRGVWKPQQFLAEIVKPAGALKERHQMVETADGSADFDIEKLLPEMNWARITAQMRAETTTDTSDDTIEARPYVLEDDRIVFLEADPNASALVIDVREDAAERVKRVDLGDLEPEMFILLRTAGGGDYIMPIANALLGNFATTARQRQQNWKSLLRAKVKAMGRRAVIDQLIEYGSEVANGMNLGNWMWPRSIRTRDYNDFLAIMRLVGLEQESLEYWQTMQRIHEAHTKAGHQIRELLLAQVNAKDLGELKRRGIMTFELSGQDAGSLTAFRIKAILKQTTHVLIWRIGVPVEVQQ